MPGPWIQELFEAQVERTPRAVAVTLAGTQLAYRELNERANQLAHLLRRLGVRPDVLVGVCMKRSPEMVVALLGVLKAGGAYVPLDPAHPRARLALVLEEIEAPILLTQSALLATLPDRGLLPICLEPPWHALTSLRRDNLPPQGDLDCLAYVIYTSGSTGRPKGVMVPHRALFNYLTWCLQAYPAGAGSGAPVQSPLTFDLTVTSLFAPLLTGQTVHLLDEESGPDALRLAFRAAGDFSLVKITPAHLEALGRQLAPHEAAGRARAFIIGGETLTARHIAFWQAFAPDTVLVNEYGPTEATVGCCVYQVPPGQHDSAAIPIGRPITNTSLHVLDPQLRPVSPGTPGELFIGGEGLARGYLNRPDLTAERFLPDPFGEPGSRLYRSGDRVRLRPDGNLEFLGRIDRQVKVRGYRVEPGEVEAALVQHPAVRQAVVLACEDFPGEKRLVAYVVAQRGQTFTPSDLRAFLAGVLPDYLVPAALVLLDELPLNGNGKVDEAALPPPARADLGPANGFVGTRTDLEARMAQLWEEVLGVGPVGVRDHFFELGGNSLRALCLVERIHKVFGRDLPTASLAAAPTVEALVRLLDGPTPPAPERALVALTPGGARPPFFCVHPIGGQADCFADLARHLGPEQPFWGIQSPRPEQGRLRPASLEALAAAYLRGVRRIQPQGPYFLGGFSFGGTTAFEMARQLRAEGQEVAFLAILDQRARPCASPPLRPGTVIEYLGNLPCWVWYDFLESGPRDLLRRLGLRLRAVLKRTAGSRSAPGKPPGQQTRAEVLAGATFDLNRLPDEFRSLLLYHFGLLSGYAVRPYPGRIILLRARAQALSRLSEPDLGWSKLAFGGVEVLTVPGSHNSILSEPNVRVLARRLGTCLETAQAAWARGEQPPLWRAWPRGADEDEAGAWQVVVNQQGQYALWPICREAPLGWTVAGPGGSRADCLAHIKQVWTDLRPLPLRGPHRHTEQAVVTR